MKTLLKVTSITILLTLLAPTALAAAVIIEDAAFNNKFRNQNVGFTNVFISDQIGYAFFVDKFSVTQPDGCSYSMTEDGGATWSTTQLIQGDGSCGNINVWYDQWTPGDTSGDKIHIVTTDVGTHDAYYTEMDISTPATPSFSTGVEVEAYTNTLGTLEIPVITKATDGALYIGMHEASQSFIRKCSSNCTTGTNWSDAGTNPLDNTDTDYLSLSPLSGGDILAIRFNDTPGDTTSDLYESKVYDSSAGTWDVSWTTIETSCSEYGTDVQAVFQATVNKSTGDIYLAMACDSSANNDGDVRTAIYSSGTWTSKTNAIDNAIKIKDTSIAIDQNTGNIYVAYTKGALENTTDVEVYYVMSSDNMTSWSSESSALGGTDGSTDPFYGTSMNAMSDERIFITFVREYGGSDTDVLGDTIEDLTPPAPTFVPEFKTYLYIAVLMLGFALIFFTLKPKKLKN